MRRAGPPYVCPLSAAFSKTRAPSILPDVAGRRSPSSGVMVDARNPIVGRDAELGAVEAFLTTAQSHFVVLTFEGEAGIGKTTIWLETVRRAGARGTRVLLTRPSEAEATLSYAALSDLFDAVTDATVSQLPVPQREAISAAHRHR